MIAGRMGGVFRHLLTAVGGALVVGGVVEPDVGAGITEIATGITDGVQEPITRQEVIGALVTLIGFAWSWREKQQRY